ncbi:MAG: xanthine dehydrogenase family Fe-S subunit [Steroidobacteraceae bacterium]
MNVVRLSVNGRGTAHDCESRTHLADFLRDTHRLTGTRLGCEHGVCGACTVLLDGRPVRSCITLAVACDGAEVVTIEGYDQDEVMAQLRTAFTKHHALQCGYCTAGMLATARDIVLRLPDADELTIRRELSGNLCRCTGYVGIVAAVKSVLDERRGRPGQVTERVPTSVQAKPAFSGFALDESSLPDARQIARDPEVAPAAAKQGWTRIDSRFELPHAVERVWEFMQDLPTVASCLPGAVLTEQRGDEVHGHVAIKFGPIRASFEGVARLERDAAAKRAILHGSGRDALAKSQAVGEVAYQLRSTAAAGTEVSVNLQYSLQGPLAQFSRSGLVKDFARRLIADFGRNVQARMEPLQDGAQREEAASLGVFAMFCGVLWGRVKRLLGIRSD